MLDTILLSLNNESDTQERINIDKDISGKKSPRYRREDPGCMEITIIETEAAIKKVKDKTVNSKCLLNATLKVGYRNINTKKYGNEKIPSTISLL